MKIYVSGSLAYDRIMNYSGYFKNDILPDKIHQLSVSFNIDSLNEKFGGTAGNIAYSLSLLNLQSTILATIGKDFSPYKKWLEDKNIDLSFLRTLEDNLTPGAYIITDKDNNQITGFHMGAMATEGNFEIKEKGIGIIAPGNIVDMMSLQDQYQSQNIPYIFDPGQVIPALQPEEMRALIQGSEAFITNDYELELVMKNTELTKEQILTMTKILITTKGGEGSTIQSGNDIVNIPAAKAEAVLDPTGAGDAYRAGIIYGLVNDLDFETMGHLASLTGVYAVEHQGTQEHSYTIEEFIKRYKQNFNQEINL